MLCPKSHFRAGGELLCDSRNFVATPPIIAIQESNDFSSRLDDSGVEGGGLTAVGFANEPDPRRKLADNFGCAIRRTIVYNQDFHLRSGKVLCQHAGDGLADHGFMIVGVDQSGYERSSHAGPRIPCSFSFADAWIRTCRWQK